MPESGLGHGGHHVDLNELPVERRRRWRDTIDDERRADGLVQLRTA